MEFYAKRFTIDERARRVSHNRSDLVGFGVVDIPAFKKSRPKLRWEDFLEDGPSQRMKIWL